MSLAKLRRLMVAGLALLCSAQAVPGTTVTFTEVSEHAGVRFTHDPLGFVSQGNFPHQNTVGTGVAAVDVNRDGWIDYIVTNGTTPGHYCFLNNGDGTFRPIDVAPGSLVTDTTSKLCPPVVVAR